MSHCHTTDLQSQVAKGCAARNAEPPTASRAKGSAESLLVVSVVDRQRKGPLPDDDDDDDEATTTRRNAERQSSVLADRSHTRLGGPSAPSPETYEVTQATPGGNSQPKGRCEMLLNAGGRSESSPAQPRGL